MEDVLVPLGLFAMVPIIIGVVVHNRRKTQAAMAEVMKEILAKGEPLTPEVISALGVRQRPKYADLRTGLILIAIGIATAIMGGVIPDPEATVAFGSLSLFPILVGAVLVGLWTFIGRQSE